MPNPTVPQTPRLIQFTRDHSLLLSHERRAFTRMAKRGPVGEVPIVSAAIPRSQTQIIRWSGTIEANGAAILRVDHEGISIISNIQDYASVLGSSASDLLSIVGAEGSTPANAKRCGGAIPGRRSSRLRSLRGCAAVSPL
jgi:hypothetical protein